MTRWTAFSRGWPGLPALVFLCALPAAAQESLPGERLKFNAAEIEVGGRVQTQFNTTTEDTEPATQLFLRRVRLDVKVQVNDFVSGRIQPEFAGRFSLKDAYLQLDFAPGLQVLAGNAHRPFSRLELTSSNRTPAIERGLAIRGVDGFDEYALVHDLDYSDRDVGVQIIGAPDGAPLGLGYAVGLFGGPLQGRVGNEGTFQIAARATVEPLEKVSVGAGWSSRDFSRSAVGDDFDLQRGNAFVVDAEYGSFAPGLHVLAELVTGDFDPFTGTEFTGAQGWLAYRTAPLSAKIFALEPTFRASRGDVDVGAPGLDELGGTLLTPGFNLYFDRMNRFMINYDHWMPDGDGDSAGSFKAQFQMAF